MIAAVSIMPFTVSATETTTITTETTIVNNTSVSTLQQSIDALESFNGKEISMEGQLFNMGNDKYRIKDNNGTILYIKVDDGRKTRKAIQKCPKWKNYGNVVGCKVSLTVEVSARQNRYGVDLSGIGYDVNFK